MIRAPTFILGFGRVGQTLLRQILDTRQTLAQRAGLQLLVVGLADSGGMPVEAKGLMAREAEVALRTKIARKGLGSLPDSQPLQALCDILPPDAIVVDATASAATSPLLLDVLAKGRSVVLANKLPVSGPLEQARVFLDHPRVRMEATVGAGLPIMGTLNRLLDTDDRILSIEGCLSGTLGYLCGELDSGASYSDSVAAARGLGYTEPDPREDLSGRDVARKAIIMGRTAGWELEMSNLTIEALYPEALAAISVDEFLSASNTQDETYEKRVQDARSKGQVLRYVARVGPEGGNVGLTAVDRSSFLGALRGPGNFVALQTARYDTEPLVISGPGAGLAVTAAGMLSDIISLARQPSMHD